MNDSVARVVPTLSGRRVEVRPPGALNQRAQAVSVAVARDGQVGRVHAERLHHRLVTQHQGAGAGADAIGRDDQVEGPRCAVRERDGDPGPVVVETGDVVAEHVLDLGRGLLDQQSSQVAAQDLQLGRGPVGVRAARGERGDGAVVGVDETDTGLPGGRGPDRVLQTHPAGDLAARAADVDVLTARPELGGPLDHGHLESVAVQPGGEGRTGDAGAGDQDSGHRRTSGCIR